MASEAKQMDSLLDSVLVLILVLVEDGFRAELSAILRGAKLAVLILVLVEDGFRVNK